MGLMRQRIGAYCDEIDSPEHFFLLNLIWRNKLFVEIYCKCDLCKIWKVLCIIRKGLSYLDRRKVTLNIYHIYMYVNRPTVILLGKLCIKPKYKLIRLFYMECNINSEGSILAVGIAKFCK